MAFNFRLETLLNLRQRKLEMEEARLAKVMARLRNCREAMEILKGKISSARQKLAMEMGAGMLASEYMQASEHITALELRLEEFRKEETRLQMEANRVRHDLKIAHREHELVDKLREKEFQEWREEMMKQEQKEADDLSTVRYVRQNQP